MIPMFSGKENLSTYSPRNMAIWFSLAFQAGTINIGGYLACHRFVTHTTGFATLFGAEIAKGNIRTALGMFTVPLFFLTGSMIAGIFVDRRINQGLRPHYSIVMFLMAINMLFVLLLGINNNFGIFGSELLLEQDYYLLALLCLTSGLQNGTITVASSAVVRTTHLTGITTDLGIGLVRALTQSYRLPRREEIQANWMRLGIILSYILGSWLAGVIFFKAEYWGFLLPFLISTGLWLMSLYYKRKHNRDTLLRGANA